MRTKARANLEAARHLIERRLFDPAAGRLYYAAFQAGVQRMLKRGRGPADFAVRAGSKPKWWLHGTIIDNAALFRGRPSDVDLFQDLRGLREEADYRESPVEAQIVTMRLADVEAFVEEVT